MLTWILIGVIVAAITLYFIFRDSNSSVIHPIIQLHNLPGSIVTASSYQGSLSPEKGRMNIYDDYWQPAYDDTDDPWIQFTFPDRYEFSSIQIKYDYNYKLDTVDILFASDDEGQNWEEPIRIYAPNNSIVTLNHTFNPTMKSKIIRIKIISGTIMSSSNSTRRVPIKVGIYGRLVE